MSNGDLLVALGSLPIAGCLKWDAPLFAALGIDDPHKTALISNEGEAVFRVNRIRVLACERLVALQFDLRE